MSVFPASDRVVAEKASTALARVIRAAILDGRLAPDQPLRETELARQLGTSRTPIREALLLLEKEGLVEAAPHRGSTVKRYDAGDLFELYGLRAVLEGYAAREAAVLITDHDIGRLEASCARYAKLRDSSRLLPQLVDENFTFHDVILHAADSSRLADMVHQLTAVPIIYKSYLKYSEENRRGAEAQHRAITEALKARDADRAADLMEHHVLWARDLAVAHQPDSG
jgi:DNA-binding GntR family transcriptional regulator